GPQCTQATWQKLWAQVTTKYNPQQEFYFNQNNLNAVVYFVNIYFQATNALNPAAVKPMTVQIPKHQAVTFTSPCVRNQKPR
ncbi:MAG: hypothetical protein ACRD51_11260, partial [Candidatus Acidiferrum sp.]